MVIAVDAMGGDFPVTAPVAGAIQAINEHGIEVILVGKQTEIESELKKYTYDHRKLSIQDCSEVVEMGESPALALRQKKDSSIRVSLNLHKEKAADAVVSVGHTGAAMATAKFVLKSINHIDRPAIATVMPSLQKPFVILDLGANTDCKPEYLLQFALMGDAYTRLLFDTKDPRIALLNNGEEEGKGNTVVKEAYELLKKSTLNFSGNIEGKAMFKGNIDVIVCDGFVGNIALKVAEGTSDFIQAILREEISKSWLAKLSFLGLKPTFRALKNRTDYKQWGGAPLLGVRGVVIIGHGNSNAGTIKGAIKHAQECAHLGLNKMISKEVDENLSLLEEAEKINR
ncbi:MAG: phosphate acyltransferase PlsX [SAR324 cluster bacterium]|nr:phosphate acyltransferase PlsX [SAR324 cluster bacterium]